eukprot:1161244-Pelagomonas_calceolata.AAC.25
MDDKARRHARRFWRTPSSSAITKTCIGQAHHNDSHNSGHNDGLNKAGASKRWLLKRSQLWPSQRPEQGRHMTKKITEMAITKT